MRLLIVEDDAPLASGLQRSLEAEGHAVDVTARGDEAVLAASQEKFDLVILDIGLPQMDGFEVLRRLRAGSGELKRTRPGRYRATAIVKLRPKWHGRFRYASCFRYTVGSGMGNPRAQCPKRFKF